MVRNEDSGAGGGYRIFKVLLFYSLFSVVLCVVLLMICSVMIAHELLPEGFIKTAPAVCGFICAFIAGFSSAKILGKTLLTGFIQGISFFIMLYFAGTIVFMRFIASDLSLSLLLASILGGTVGGLTAAGGKKRRNF